MIPLDAALHHIYLLPGFDPGGTRTLLRMLRKELAQAGQMKLKSMGHRGHISDWVVLQEAGSGDVPLVLISVLSWDDIVRRRWTRTPWRLCWQGMRLYLNYIWRRRTWRSMHRLPKASFTFFWPLCFVLAFVIAAFISLICLASLPLPLLLRLLMTTGAIIGWLIYGVQEAERRRVSWLFRAIHFSCNLSHGEGVDLAARLDIFADQIEMAVAARPDRSVTITGHSTGCYLAVNLALRLERRSVPHQAQGGFQLLTLGQNPALMASLSTREQVRLNLATLLDIEVDWTDITCRDDWMSFAEANLLEVLGCNAKPGLRHLQVPLAEAAGLLSISEVLNHQFLLHFQYFRHAGPGKFSCLSWLLPPSS